MSGIVVSKLGSQVGAILSDRAYWAIKRRDGSWLCELDPRFDIRNGRMGELQWHDDVVANGDVLNIAELWLFCPRSAGHPFGQTACIVVPPEMRGCAFLFKGAGLAMTGGSRWQNYVVIGKVTDKLTGACVAFAWDYGISQLIKTENNVFAFHFWREELGPPREMSPDVIGLRLS